MSAPWEIARDQEREARRRRDPDKQAELDAARGLPTNAEQAKFEACRVGFSDVTKPLRGDAVEPVGPIGPGEEIATETAFERAMREGLGAALDSAAQELASLPGPGPGVISLEGAEMIAYVRVKAASIAALAAQNAYAMAGAELRAAIDAMCQLLAPSVK